MKSTKSIKAKPAREEECGIWLDTKELKEKKQQLTRPMTSRLTLSFTQTKLHMPVTRQSIISSFFTHTHTDPNRSATHTGTTHSGTTHTGNKRKHGMTSDSTCQSSELDLQTRDGDCDGPSDRDQKERRFFHLIRGGESENEEPPGKRRHVAHYIQEYDQTVLKTQQHHNNEENPDNMVYHGGHKATVKGRVLTSRPVNQAHRRTEATPIRRTGKENLRPGSPLQGPAFTRQVVSSPAKGRLKEKHTLLSPEKCVSAGETLASLFTQDSEGLCVIAHRDRHSLEERGSYGVCASGQEEEEEEEEEEVLFTQDSEGNMVIKH